MSTDREKQAGANTAGQSALIETLDVKRTERGWAGHFICADRCLFRRNTLLEYGKTRIVVSSVGLMKGEGKFTTIGYDRHFETMAFMAQRVSNRYWDADVSQQLSLAVNTGNISSYQFMY